MTVDKTHPRYESLLFRDKIVKAGEQGLLAPSALISHGRGEAFDYLIGEKTTFPAKRAMYVAIASMIIAENPVISVNGNTTALVIDEIIKLAEELDAKIEINLFYRTPERIEKLAKLYEEHGYPNVLGTDDDDLEYINNLNSPRASASKEGIYTSDVVLVPLEDGDRAEILAETGKKIITIDLNPLSRTSKKSDISIVDNIVRAIPLMIEIAKDLKEENNLKLIQDIINDFNNEDNLQESLQEFKIKEEE
ncbi:MAG: phosphopantothenate/pantothenate synthetase [Methanobrevibacter sp.]|nr:phosphopantothenate/pantothenate synthetase [Methanobrevibacter sp.]